MTTSTIEHIAGGAFGLLLCSEQCPINVGGEPISDTQEWKVELILVGSTSNISILGVWISSSGPEWRLSFNIDNTTAWPAGTHDLRLAYTAPEVEPARQFFQPLTLAIEIKR